MDRSIESITAALRHVPSADRDVWVKMGMAVKSELGDAGFDVWDEWSQIDGSYRERDARDVWRSIKAGGGIGIGTLFQEAKRGGWRPSINGSSRPSPSPRPRERTTVNVKDDDRRRDAATEATMIWDKAKPAPADHAYLVAKQIEPHGIRAMRGLLVIPARDATGKITTLETISGSGEKLFLAGGKKSGSYYMIGEPEGAIAIAEGFATAASFHEATGLATAVAFDAGNLMPVAKAIHTKYPAMPIVVCADDDVATPGNPGVTKATKAAAAVNGSIAIPSFGDDRPDGATDFNDLARHRGHDAIRMSMALLRSPTDAKDDAPATAAGTSDRVAEALAKAFTFGDASITTALPYVLKGVFGRGQLIVFWGKPGSGKTFATMELVGHIGSGADYHGRRTRCGAVLYVAAESARVYTENRIAALKRHRPELAAAAVVVLPIGLDLLHTETGDVDLVIDAARRLEPDYGAFSLVVIDTLAVTFGGGNENAPEDMGAYVGNVQRIVRETGAAVLLVHHCGKDEARGMRGHSALLGALDAELAIEGDGDVRVLRTGKVREGDAYADLFGFRLERVELGDDDDGDPVTTCVVVRCDPQAGRPTAAKLPKTAMLALRCLEESIQEHGASLPATSAIPAGTKGVRSAVWRDRYNLRDAVGDDAPDAKKAKDARDHRFERARIALLNAGKVGALGDSVWIN